MAKQNFARFSSVFMAIGAILVVASFLVSLPSYLSSLPSTQEIQDLATRTSQLTMRDASNPQLLRQISDGWMRVYFGGDTAATSTYLMWLTLFLMLGVMVLHVGLSHVALRASAGASELKVKESLEPLKRFGRWLGLYLMTFLRIYLWTLLFFIPGLIAAYRYRQAVYLMLEDPELGINQALRLSGQLMKGHKWELFVLDLSFILWFVLQSLTVASFKLNIVGLYFLPYLELTRVQFYRDLRAEHPIEGLAVVGALPPQQPPLTP
ncbi:MAG: DUF975 family protein [Actinomycetia bacterium]|nr:DUF975 family protein [Actinomycetes bacterium]